MALSLTSSIANLFSSIFTPSSKPPPAVAPQSHLSLESSSAKERRTPLIQTNELQHQQDVLSVVCPSLAYSNTLYFGAGYNVQLIADDNEPEEKLVGRFRREVMRAGIIQECKRRRFYENKQEKLKRKNREAAKRNRRRRPFVRTDPEGGQGVAAANKSDDDKDNWDVPEGGLPY